MYQACYMPDMLGARDTILSKSRHDRHLTRIYKQQRYLFDFYVCGEENIGVWWLVLVSQVQLVKVTNDVTQDKTKAWEKQKVK